MSSAFVHCFLARESKQFQTRRFLAATSAASRRNMRLVLDLSKNGIEPLPFRLSFVSDKLSACPHSQDKQKITQILSHV